MTYRIEGLQPDQFAPLFHLPEEELALRGIRRIRAAESGYPCRLTLEDAAEGETLLLLNYTSHDVRTPYRSAYAIYVREGAGQAAAYVDEPAPVMQNRPLGLRGFDQGGMLKDARLALPGQADQKIRKLFKNSEIREIHAHNAAHGCFSARIVRD